jgi:predicted ATP-dependent serine protease
MIKCLSCGYLHPEIQLNCPQCGSFYTQFIEDEPAEKIESKAFGIIDKIKRKLEQLIPTRIHHD